MGFAVADLTDARLAPLCRGPSPPGAAPAQIEFALDALDGHQGVISRYQPSTADAIVGHRVLTLRWTADGARYQRQLVVKAKAPGGAIRTRLAATYHRFDPHLVALQRAVSPSILDDCHRRELAVYELAHPALRAITPRIEAVWRDDAADVYVIVMELLAGVRHASTLDDLDAWTPRDLACVLDQIAPIHAAFLGMSANAPADFLVPFAALHGAGYAAYCAGLLEYNARAFPELFAPARRRALAAVLDRAPARRRRIADRPLTLIHGDFTPRNTCLRSTGAGLTLCAYDWELAQVHLPARDVCEFLCYALHPADGWSAPHVPALLDRYRTLLATTSDRPLSNQELRHDMAMAIEEFCAFKLLVQGITHQLLGKRAYFERLVANAFAGLAAFGADA